MTGAPANIINHANFGVDNLKGFTLTGVDFSLSDNTGIVSFYSSALKVILRVARDKCVVSSRKKIAARRSICDQFSDLGHEDNFEHNAKCFMSFRLRYSELFIIVGTKKPR